MKWESFEDLSQIHMICPSFPLFKQHNELKAEINDTKRRHKFTNGQLIFEQGKLAEGIYIIVKGIAEETFPTSDWINTHNRGSEVGYANIFGAENKLHDNYINMSTLKGAMVGEYIFLETSLVQQIEENYPDFQSRIYKMALLGCIKGSSKSSLQKYDPKVIQYIASKSILKIKGDRNMIGPFRCGGYLFRGELRHELNNNLGENIDSYTSPQAGELIRPSNETYICEGECAILEFTEPLEEDEGVYNLRPSFNRGSVSVVNRISNRGSVRDTISEHLIDDAAQTHQEFTEIVRNEFPNLGL